jgi:hypothetical protein
MMRPAVIALLALGTLHPTTPTTIATAATPIDGIAMVREMKLDPMAALDGGSSMALTYDSYVLFRGGIAIRGIPAGAPSSWDAEALARANPNLASRWSEVGKTLHLVTTRGDVKDFKDWFRMTPGATDERLDGVWFRAGSVTQQDGGRTSTASAIRELALHPDGRFEGALSGGASSGTDAGGFVAASQRGSRGRYLIDGYEVEFTYDDGRVVKQLYCYSSAEHGTLLVGGARMTLKRRR